VGSRVSTRGRKPGAYTYEEAKKLTGAAWSRDANRRKWVAILRHMYRTGRLDTNVKSIDLVKPLWDRSSDVERDIMNINFARQQIDTIVASIAGRLPDISFDPAVPSPEYIEAADYAAALVNGFIEQDDMTQTLYAMAKDASVSGHGFGHVRWVRRVRSFTQAEIQEQRDQVLAEFNAQMSAQGYLDVAPPADLFDSIPTEEVLENRPTVEYISPANVLVPSNIRELREAAWYAVVSFIRLSELRGDETFDQAAVEELAPGTDADHDEITRRDTANNNEDTVDPLVKVLFFYDVSSHRLIVLGERGSRPLYEGENPNPFRDICLVDLPGHRDGEQFFGFGDLEGIAGLLEKAAIATRQQVLNLQNQGPVFVTWQDTLSREDESKIKTARPYDIIKLSPETYDSMREKFGENVSPAQAIAQLTTNSPLPADVFNVKNELKSDAAEISGVTEFMQGSAGDPRVSGTAAAAAEGWTTVRMSVREQAVLRAFQRIAQLFFKFCQAHLTEDDVVRLVGPMGETWEETVDVQRISDDFFVRIRTGSMSASNPAARAQRGRELMGLADQMEDRGYDVTGLREIALRDLAIDPRQARLEKLPPAQPEPAPGTDVPGMPMGGGAVPPEMAPMPSPQDQMGELGGPPLPGADGGFAF
jgi:hypothetical protein